MFQSESLGFLTSGQTAGTTVTSGGSSHTKGTWTSLGTLSQSANGLMLQCVIGNNIRCMFDVRVGGDTVAENIYFVNRTIPIATGFQNVSFPLPKLYGSGDDVEIRTQTNSSSTDHVFVGQAYFNPFMVGAGNHGYYGQDLSNTTAEQIDPGGTANTESAVSELTTSSGLDFDVDLLLLSVNQNDATVGSNDQAVVRIYTGASGTNDSGIKAILAYSVNLDHGWNHLTGPIPVSRQVFAAGTRVWFSVQSNDTTAGDRNIDVCINCWDLKRPGGF